MKKNSFTLSEILITLTIIGIIASITIPNILLKINDRQNITAVKKAYSMLDSALSQMYLIEGKPSEWDDLPEPETNYSATNANYFAEKLSRYLNVSKYCGSGNSCFNYGYICNTYHKCFKNLDGNIVAYYNYTEVNQNGKMMLKNSMCLSVGFNIAPKKATQNQLKNGIIEIRVDTNCSKGPNTNGLDVFYFYSDLNGLILNTNNYSSDLCNKSISKNKNTGCAQWILRHNNMDYKYHDVSEKW